LNGRNAGSDRWALFRGPEARNRGCAGFLGRTDHRRYRCGCVPDRLASHPAGL